MMVGMSLLPLSCLRVWVLRLCGVKIGRGCYIGFNVICDTNFPSLIEIGNNVTISHNTLVYAHTATPTASYLSTVYDDIKKVKIGDGAWVGASCTILPGAIVADNCMIGAGSVVSKTTTSFTLYAGNPCKKIKDLPKHTTSKEIS
jgi:acetyltransferase-like isoleucine patch superfamily enzyme